MKPCRILLAGLSLVASLHAGAGPQSASAKPNIVFILADDLGWRDLRISGNPWHDTPHIDRFALQGRRFTNAYAPAPICSASRTAFLTGRSPARLHFEFVTKLRGTRVDSDHPLVIPSYPLDLPLSEVTLGEVLRSVGYRTGFYGKWHVSRHNGGYLKWSDSHGPLQQGFQEGDQDFGLHPYGDPERPPEEMRPLANGDYGDDSLTDKAVDFLRRHRDERFFLYLSHYFVHTPIRSRAKWLVEKYRKRVPPDANPDRAVYAAMVETLDEFVGRVLDELDRLGLAQNTVVVFTSDNGGNPNYADNGPARGSKWNVYEGGIRVPFFVRWPGRIPSGSTEDTPIIGTDLLPTLAALSGAALDPAIPLDGANLLPLWLGTGAVERPAPLFWHFPYYHPETEFAEALPRIGTNDYHISQTRPQSALRQGVYKIVHFYEGSRDEVYDLSTDPGELYDLSGEFPGKTQELRARLDAYLKQVDARLPQPK